MAACGSGLSSKSKAPAPLQCKWSGCEACEGSTEFASVDELARHVRMAHVEPFESLDVVVCQWEGCKVYNRPSSSFQWLQRHVQQAHTKDRPFKCIMNGCNMSFNTREALQRHVYRHLEPNVATSPSAAGSAAANSPLRKNQAKNRRSGGKMTQGKRVSSSPYFPGYLHYRDPPPKHLFELPSDSSIESEDYGRKGLGRKKPLCLKVRIPRCFVSLTSLQQGPAHFNGAHIHTDVWDHKTMSVIRQACNQLTHVSMTSPELCVTLTANILGKRRCPSASEDDLLVRWSPFLTSDSWIPVSQFSPKRSIPFSQLSSSSLSLLASHCFSCSKTRNRRSKRKP